MSTFGDKEYSILSALGSNRQATKLQALKAVADIDFVKSLSSNEIFIVEFVILQLINQGKMEIKTLELMLQAIKNIVITLKSQ